MTTLHDLAARPIWVSWQTEPGDGGRHIKMPYAPGNGTQAKSNNPATWGTREAAAARAEGLPKPLGQGGVGLVLEAIAEGLHLGGADLDACGDPATGMLAPWAREIVERLNSYTEVSPSNIGIKIFFLYETAGLTELRARTRIQDACTARRKGEGPKDPGIELYLAGRYFTVTDRQTSASAELRTVSVDDLAWLVEAAIPAFRGKVAAPKAAAPLSIEDIASAFAVIPNDDLPWDEWNDRGMKIYAATDGSEEGYLIFDAWSRKASVYQEEATRARWEHYHRSPPDRVGPGSIIFLARQADPEWTSPSRASLPFSEEAMALRFAAERCGELRYVAQHNRYFEWAGTHWKIDNTLRAFDLVRAMCRKAAAEASPISRAALARAKTVAAIERLAKCDRRIAATVDQWDTDPWLLGTPGGTVDLRTGKLRPSGPEDYITKITATAPGGECPQWRKFIGEVTRGNAELGKYLQRLAGYSMTGSVREHAFIFLHGDGTNGKTTFVETLAYALGDYGTVVAMNTLVVTSHPEHPTEIAKLCGRRLATASETTEGMRWNVARIKLLTGGDSITARFMRGDYFDFKPTHKLMIFGNKRPLLGVVDEAIRRRLHLVPFTVRFDRPDKELGEKLRGEAAGILSWMIEGCLEWQRISLAPPKEVTAATEKYLAEQDDIQLWMDECCVTGKAYHDRTSELFASWKEWAERNGAWAGSVKAFSQTLEARGFKRVEGLRHSEFTGVERGHKDEDEDAGDKPGTEGGF